MKAAVLILGLSALSATAPLASVEVRFDGGGSLLADKVEIRGGLAVLTLPGGGQLAVEHRRIQALTTIDPAPDPPSAEPAVIEKPTEVAPASAAIVPPLDASPPAPALPAPPGREHGGYWDLIHDAALRHGLEPELLRCVLLVESGFDPSAISPKGAMGIAQLMPGTAGELGVVDPLDPVQSIEGAADLLSKLLRESGGRFVPALAAYNAGRGAVRRYGGVPPYGETIRYVEKVLTLYFAR